MSIGQCRFEFEDFTINFKLTKAVPSLMSDYEVSVMIASFVMDHLYPAKTETLTIDYSRSDDHGYTAECRQYPVGWVEGGTQAECRAKLLQMIAEPHPFENIEWSGEPRKFVSDETDLDELD